MYARGKSYVNQALVLYVLKTRSKRTRVGLTATKKIGHAVQRNRARRGYEGRQSTNTSTTTSAAMTSFSWPGA